MIFEEELDGEMVVVPFRYCGREFCVQEATREIPRLAYRHKNLLMGF